MTPLWLAAVGLAADAPDLAPLQPETQPAPIVRLVATGATGGIGGGRYDLMLPDGLRAALDAAGATVTRVEAHRGVLSRGDAALIADDHRAGTIAGFLDADRLDCGPPSPAEAQLTRTSGVLVDSSAAPAMAELMDGLPAQIRRCTVGSLGASLVHAQGTAVPDDLTGFEFRLGLTVDVSIAGNTERVEVLGRPDREATRKIGATRRLLAEAPDALFIDAGSFVDGASSVVDGALSLHRPTGFATLRALEPAALAPGRTELAAGLRPFYEESDGLPYTAANWEAADGAPDLPASIRVTTAQGVSVAFVGFVDPGWLRWVPADPHLRLSAPVAAVQAEVDRLRATDPPDVIVVLGEASAGLLRDLQRGLHDVDLLVGDAGPRIDGVESLTWSIREPWANDPPPAATLPLDGVLEVELELGPDRVTEVRAHPIRVNTALEPDAAVLAAVNAVRSQSYPRLDRPLLPAGPDPTAALTDEVWTTLICQSALETTGADVALLPELPAAPPIPGPLSELLVVDQLALLDQLVVHEVPGDRFGRLLDKAYGVVPNHCGAPLGSRSPKARGRAIEADRVYRVVTTDRAVADPVLASLLDEAHSPWLLDMRRAVRPVLGPGGRPRTLRAATLNVLRALNAADEDPTAVLTARSYTDITPQWLFRSRRVSFALERFQGAEDERYAEFPETLATSASSTTLDATADVALDYSSRGLNWDLRAVAMYSQLTTADDQQEPADDLRLSTSGSLPLASFPVGSLAFMPYSEVLFDSEFTAVENDDGSLNPLQRDASLTVGLSTKRAAVLTGFRLGAFALRDLTVTDKPTELGVRTDGEIRVTLGTGMYWTTVFDAFLWADTPTPDASDLRFKALVDTRIQLALARWLSTSLYAQSFSFAGRVPETAKPGQALTVGVALDVLGAFRL
ncbi:MAG: hypothetical protein ACI8PZ_005366 [Myxococcota bacterium]|jgi:hypothetical protein